MPHSCFRPGGAWIAPQGELLVERSVPTGADPVLDVFHAGGRMVRQLTLPAGRRVVGTGRGVIYAVVRDQDDLERLEKYETTRA